MAKADRYHGGRGLAIVSTAFAVLTWSYLWMSGGARRSAWGAAGLAIMMVAFVWARRVFQEELTNNGPKILAAVALGMIAQSVFHPLATLSPGLLAALGSGIGAAPWLLIDLYMAAQSRGWRRGSLPRRALFDFAMLGLMASALFLSFSPGLYPPALNAATRGRIADAMPMEEFQAWAQGVLKTTLGPQTLYQRGVKGYSTSVAEPLRDFAPDAVTVESHGDPPIRCVVYRWSGGFMSFGLALGPPTADADRMAFWHAKPKRRYIWKDGMVFWVE